MANPIIRNINVTPNDKYNSQVLIREIEDAGLSVNLVSSDYDSSTEEMSFLFDSEPTSGDEIALDAVLSAHSGDDFDTPPYLDINEGILTDDTGNEVTSAEILNIMPEPGNYVLYAYQELATTTNDGTHAAKGRLYVTRNSNRVERAEGHNDQNMFQNSVSISFQFSVTAGDIFSFELTLERIGSGTGNPAQCQRRRLSIKKTYG